MWIQRHEEEEKSGVGWCSLWLFYFICLSLPNLSLGLYYVNWASQECCLLYLRSSLRSSDLLLFYFRGLFPSLSFSHRHFGLFFPILPTYQNHSVMFYNYHLFKSPTNFGYFGYYNKSLLQTFNLLWLIHLGLPRWRSGKESTANVGDAGSVSGLERSPGKGNGTPL